MKKIFSFVFAVLISISFFAATSHAKNEPSVEEIAAIENAYNLCADLSAKFTQTTRVALIDRVVARSGIFKFKKGGKFRIEYQGKDAKHYVSDGTTLWVYIPGDDSSLQTFAVDDESVPKEALSFMNGFGKLKKEFGVSKSAAFKEVKPGETALHLVPKSKKPQFESLDALFGTDHLLSELIINNQSGNTSQYIFSEIKTNKALPDSGFTISNQK